MICEREIQRCKAEVMALPTGKRSGSVDGLEDWFCAQLMEEFPFVFENNDARHKIRIDTAQRINYAIKKGKDLQQLADLSSDAPTVVNKNGGKGSYIPFRFDLMRGILATVIIKLAGVLKHGSKYGDDNWHNVSPQEHINHALTHIFAFLQGDDQDDHVSHFVCRATMFAATLEDPRWIKTGPGNYELDPRFRQQTEKGYIDTQPKYDPRHTNGNLGGARA